MCGDTVDCVLNMRSGLLPDFSAQVFEFGGGLLEFGVNGSTFVGGEIKIRCDDGLDVSGGTINGSVFAAGMRNGMLGDAPHYQEAAADAASGAEDENEREKEKRLPSRMSG